MCPHCTAFPDADTHSRARTHSTSPSRASQLCGSYSPRSKKKEKQQKKRKKERWGCGFSLSLFIIAEENKKKRRRKNRSRGAKIEGPATDDSIFWLDRAYNGVPNFSTLLDDLPMLSMSRGIVDVRHNRGTGRTRRRSRGANFLGASATTFRGQDIGCTSHGGESYGFSIVSRGCFDLVDGRRWMKRRGRGMQRCFSMSKKAR